MTGHESYLLLLRNSCAMSDFGWRPAATQSHKLACQAVRTTVNALLTSYSSQIPTAKKNEILLVTLNKICMRTTLTLLCYSYLKKIFNNISSIHALAVMLSLIIKILVVYMTSLMELFMEKLAVNIYGYFLLLTIILKIYTLILFNIIRLV